MSGNRERNERAVINSKGADFRLADRLVDETPSSPVTGDNPKSLIDVEPQPHPAGTMYRRVGKLKEITAPRGFWD